MNNNGSSKIGCGTVIFIVVILLFLLFGGSSNNSSSSSTRTTTRTTQSNPIRDRDPEFYDYLEDRYNEMIRNQ